jgi:4-hydroxy-tetrahydrodipicolinate reductase
VESGEVPAIIAPNMAAPIVVLQAAVRHVAERFPGALSQYSLAVEESHQAAKRDVSGTALQLLGGFRALGLNLSTKAIVSHRDPEYQSRVLGVPEAHLHGHGWHWYRAHSADGSVALELSHRINGRRVYAEGALTAVRFLRRQIAQGCRGRVFSMLEVLEGAE